MIKRLGTLVLGCIVAFSTVFALAGCATQEYQPSEKSPTVSPSVIVEQGVLRVGVTTENNTPFAGQVSGKIVGLDVDVAAAIADSLGLKLELVDVGTDVDTALANKQVDIVMGIEKTTTQVTCWRSEAYVESAVALFAQPGTTDLPTSANAATLKIAAQSSSMSAWEVRNQFGDEALSATNDLKSAFDQLSGSRATYVAADAVIGTYAAESSNLDVHIVGLMQNPSGYCVGVLDSNAELKKIISDTLVTLSGNGMISIIETKWLGTSLSLADLPKTEGAKKASTDSTTEGTGDTANAATTTPEAGSNAVQQPETSTGNAAAA
ncbi:MAG: transporter substrate-binding domain-containing protein [Raoultibacter sp.]